jgi:hypothetical protein
LEEASQVLHDLSRIQKGLDRIPQCELKDSLLTWIESLRSTPAVTSPQSVDVRADQVKEWIKRYIDLVINEFPRNLNVSRLPKGVDVADLVESLELTLQRAGSKFLNELRSNGTLHASIFGGPRLT